MQLDFSLRVLCFIFLKDNKRKQKIAPINTDDISEYACLQHREIFERIN